MLILLKFLDVIKKLITPLFSLNVPNVTKNSTSNDTMKTQSLTINRIITNNQAIIGHMELDNQFVCYTLEHPELHIPEGTYPILLQESPRFEMLTPHLQNVPGRTFIEIHPGNTEKDTEGCILVGQSHDNFDVFNSKDAFIYLMSKLDPSSQFSLTIL